MERIKQCIECIDRNAFNRDKQRECVLNLYPTKNTKDLEERDKSIFRGMVLHSLRHLGLIVGSNGAIRASANGRLIVESKSIDRRLQDRVVRAIIYELDAEVYKFISIIEKNPSLSSHDFYEEIAGRINPMPERQKNERIHNWLLILSQAELVNYSSGKVSANREKLEEAIADVNSNPKSSSLFEKYFLDTYLRSGKSSAGIVDIIDAREGVSIRFLKEQEVILTERQFDAMLRNTLSQAHKYVVSLGKPMGQREKLFEYKGDYFRTVFIRTGEE